MTTRRLLLNNGGGNMKKEIIIHVANAAVTTIDEIAEEMGMTVSELTSKLYTAYYSRYTWSNSSKPEWDENIKAIFDEINQYTFTVYKSSYMYENSSGTIGSGSTFSVEQNLNFGYSYNTSLSKHVITLYNNTTSLQYKI